MCPPFLEMQMPIDRNGQIDGGVKGCGGAAYAITRTDFRFTIRARNFSVVPTYA